MDKSQEAQDLLIRLASSLKEEDLLEDPALEQQLVALLEAMAPKNELPPEVVAELSKIEDKKQRFIYAMTILKVVPEMESIKALAQAMQSAGLLNSGPINMPHEEPHEEPLEEGHSEEPLPQEDDSPDLESHAEDVDINDKDVLDNSTHRWK
jgi:hypothetical protein